MGDKISLKIDERTLQGKKVKALRKQGLTPGVVYGPGMEPMAIQADAGEVRKGLVGERAVRIEQQRPMRAWYAVWPPPAQL